MQKQVWKYLVSSFGLWILMLIGIMSKQFKAKFLMLVAENYSKII